MYDLHNRRQAEGGPLLHNTNETIFGGKGRLVLHRYFFVRYVGRSSVSTTVAAQGPPFSPLTYMLLLK